MSEEAIEELDAAAQDVANAHFQAADLAIRRFLSILDESPLREIVQRLPKVECGPILLAATGQSHGMAGLKPLDWPAKTPERVSAQLDVLNTINDGKMHITAFVTTFFFVDKSLQRCYDTFVSQVFQPFYRDLLRIITRESKNMSPRPDEPQAPHSITDHRKVFVVHGRNENARNAMFTFLRAIKLDPIEWTEAVQITPGASPYVGQILDHAFAQAKAVVVLFTGDDEARLREPLRSKEDTVHESSLTPQARPNVLFEAGLAFGTHPDRTILVELGPLRPFSDIGGRNVIRINDSTESRQALAMRLIKSGCAVVLSGTDWHTAGSFDSAVIPSSKSQSDPATKSSDETLDDAHLAVLTLLSELDVGLRVTIDTIASRLGRSSQSALYYVEELIDKEYVSAAVNPRVGMTYALDIQGRAYLVRIGHL